MHGYKTMKKVFVAIPCNGFLMPLCVQSLFRVASYSRKDCVLDVRFISGYGCEMARNEATRQFIRSDAEYLWFVDSDIVLADQSLERLLAMDADVASGVYFRKTDDGDRVAEVCFAHEDKTVFYRQSTLPYGVFETDAVGAGCLLIKRHVMERCAGVSEGGRVFVYSHDPVISEDIWFCNLVKNLGFNIMVDGDLRLGHVGSVIF